jgi:hypothetical protein
MRRRAGLVLTVIMTVFIGNAGARQQPASSAQPDPWRPLRFLVGTWDAKTEGGSAGASAVGAYTFQLELKNHVLARHTMSEGCKAPADFNCDHGDLLYVYADRTTQALRAIYFDNEGHVINYDVTTPAPDTALFLSSASQPGPQFRLSYTLKAGVMRGEFQLKMPGQTTFTPYLVWSGSQKK